MPDPIVRLKTFKVKCQYCSKEIERNFSKRVGGFTCFGCRKKRAKEKYFGYRMRKKEAKDAVP